MAFKFKLIPRQEAFFEMFNRSANAVVQAARLLNDLLTTYEEVDRKVRHLKDIEHSGDEITHEIYDALNRSFVAPFERDDVGRLASALDDVTDWIEEAGRRMYVYGLGPPTTVSQRFGQILVEQAEAIARAVPHLESRKRAATIRSQMVEIHRLENEADALMDEALGGLYTDVHDIQALIKAIQWSHVYEVLEEATDKAEQVSVVFENILVKSG